MDQEYIAELTCPHGVLEFTGREVCLICVAIQAALEAQCLIHGHTIKAETHAGPESGSDDICCTSCGQDFSVTYY